jgi:hypothetical protein
MAKHVDDNYKWQTLWVILPLQKELYIAEHTPGKARSFILQQNHPCKYCPGANGLAYFATGNIIPYHSTDNQ